MRMLYATLALLGVIFAPVGSGAQPVPAHALIPVRGLVPTTAQGIVVNGTATTHVPATSAQLTLMLASRTGTMTLNAKALQPVVDALVASGVPRDSVQLPIALTAPGNMNAVTIVGTVDHPTTAMIEAGVVRVGGAIAAMPGVILTSAMVRASVANCENPQDAIRGRAIDNARAKAATIAKQVGVKLGPVLAVNSFDAPLEDGSCVWQYYIGAYSPNGAMTPGDYLSVPITSNVQITFGIK